MKPNACPQVGRFASSGAQGGTVFADPTFAKGMSSGKLTRSAIDRFTIVIMGGIAAESIQYGNSEVSFFEIRDWWFSFLLLLYFGFFVLYVLFVFVFVCYAAVVCLCLLRHKLMRSRIVSPSYVLIMGGIAAESIQRGHSEMGLF